MFSLWDFPWVPAARSSGWSRDRPGRQYAAGPCLGHPHVLLPASLLVDILLLLAVPLLRQRFFSRRFDLSTHGLSYQRSMYALPVRPPGPGRPGFGLSGPVAARFWPWLWPRPPAGVARVRVDDARPPPKPKKTLQVTLRRAPWLRSQGVDLLLN